MCSDESPGDLDAYPTSLRFNDRTSIESFPQRLAFEQFDNHERVTVMRADVEYLDDVRVIERGRDSRFTKKTFDAQFVGHAEGGERLQRDPPVPPSVGRPIDDAHSAASDARVDPVWTDEDSASFVSGKR